MQNLLKKSITSKQKITQAYQSLSTTQIKATIQFLGLFVILLPIIVFVPIIGSLIMLFLWAILLKDPTLYDITSLFNKDFEKYKNSKALWIISIIASTFNYIPILNIFAPLFAYIMFMHYILSEDN